MCYYSIMVYFRPGRYGEARTDIDTLLDELTEQAVRLGLIEKEGAA